MNHEEKQAARRRRPALAAATVSAAALLVTGVQAQGQERTLATFGLSFGGQYTANDPDEDESRFTTGLSFDLRSVTRRQSFGLSADGQFILDDEGFDFDQPRIALDYGLANRSTAFNVALSYSIRDVEGSSELIDPVTGNLVNLIDDDGTLESLGLNAGLQTGRDAPFGTDTRFNFTSRTYSGTSDPDLSDLESWQIGTTLRFEVDPRIVLRASTSYRETQEDNVTQTESRTTRFGVGANLLIDPLWSASVDLRYSLFETEEDVFGRRVLTEDDGLGFSFGLTRQFRDGTLGLSFARQESDDGAEDSVTLSRERSLSNGGELAWSLGLVSFPSGDIAPVASALYARPTARGNFSVSLQQSTVVNDDDENVVSTSIGLNYGQDINAMSSWSLDGSLSSVNVLDGDEDDQARAAVGVTYNHALTEDWGLSTSLRHQITYEGGERDNSASILSLSLERSFSFRP
jgi:hypothetical protein